MNKLRLDVFYLGSAGTALFGVVECFSDDPGHGAFALVVALVLLADATVWSEIVQCREQRNLDRRINAGSAGVADVVPGPSRLLNGIDILGVLGAVVCVASLEPDVKYGWKDFAFTCSVAGAWLYIVSCLAYWIALECRGDPRLRAHVLAKVPIWHWPIGFILARVGARIRQIQIIQFGFGFAALCATVLLVSRIAWHMGGKLDGRPTCLLLQAHYPWRVLAIWTSVYLGAYTWFTRCRWLLLIFKP